MSANITVRTDGFAEAAFAVKPAWHGLGQLLDHQMTSREALESAGLDWGIRQCPVAWGEVLEVETSWNRVENAVANIRDDNGEFLGLVSDKYKLVTNREAFAFLDRLTDQEEVRYEAAFSLGGGRVVCILAQMPGEFIVGDSDRNIPYVLLTTAHDGTAALQVGGTSVRVVCANTRQLALQEGAVREISIRHTGDIMDKLQQVREILSGVKKEFQIHAEQAAVLADYRMTPEDWRTYMDVMCPRLQPADPDWTPRRARAIEDTRTAIEQCYIDPQNRDCEFSAWAAYNAVSQHVDHLPRRGATPQRKAEARFNVTFYGPGRQAKDRAYDAAMRIATGVSA